MMGYVTTRNCESTAKLTKFPTTHWLRQDGSGILRRFRLR